MDDEFPMAAVGPDDDDESFSQPTSVSIPIPRESQEDVKRHIELSNKLPGRKLDSFMGVYNSDEVLEFLIPDVLPRGGLVFLGGLSATGKTILGIQVCVDLVLNRPTMTWKQADGLPQLRVLMLSLEMPKPECQRRLRDIYPSLSETEEKLLEENFFVYSDAEPFQLWDTAHVVDLIRLIGQAKPDVVLIDSASVSLASSLKDDTQVNESLKNLYMVRARMGVSMIIVAHTRKPNQNISSSPEEASINELFGHSGIAQAASSIFLLVEDEKTRVAAIKEKNGDKVDKVVLNINVKTRFGAANAAYKMKLPSRESTLAGAPLQFRRDAIELGSSVITQEQRRKLKEKPSPLSASLGGIDFKELLKEGDDDI